MKYLILIVLLTGCTFAQPSSRINKVSIGMTKEQVITAVGHPVSTSATDTGVEYLNYSLCEGPFEEPRPYFVRFRNGKVDAYGRLGDFDSTRSPTINLKIDH